MVLEGLETLRRVVNRVAVFQCLAMTNAQAELDLASFAQPFGTLLDSVLKSISHLPLDVSSGYRRDRGMLNKILNDDSRDSAQICLFT